MRLAATLITLSSLFLSGCGSESGDHFDARAELEKTKGPAVGTMEQSLLQQAQQAVSGGDCKRAAETYKQLIDKFPEKNEYMLSLAECLRRDGKNEVALNSINVYLKKEPGSVAGMETRAIILMNLGEFTEAGKNFGEVMKSDPHRWRTLNGIGILFAMKGLNKEAIAYYDAALGQSPDNASVLNNKGLTLAMDKRYDEAEAVFINARSHMPRNGAETKNIDLNLALVYAIAGKLDEAEQAATPHLDQASLYNNMAFYAYLAKNTDLARGYLDMALTHSPTYYERAWRNIAALNGGMPSSGPDGDHFLKGPAPGSPPPAIGNYVPRESNVEMVPPVVSKAGGTLGTPLSDIPEPRQ